MRIRFIRFLLFAGLFGLWLSSEPLAENIATSKGVTADKEANPSVHLDDVCKDVLPLSCQTLRGPFSDGTGSFSAPSVLSDERAQKLREYFHEKVVSEPNFQSRLSNLMNNPNNSKLLQQLTGANCNISESKECADSVRLKLRDILADEFLKDAGFKDRGTIASCFSDCRYSDSQIQAFRRLYQTNQIFPLIEKFPESYKKFWAGQNSGVKTDLKKTFGEIKAQAKITVAGMGLSNHDLAAIYRKIESTELSTDCVGPHPINSMAWSHAGNTRKIIVCEGLVDGNTSKMALVFALSHEISHQFDPCYIHLGNDGFKYQPITNPKSQDDFRSQNPFAKGIECLQDGNGVGAMPNDNYVFRKNSVDLSEDNAKHTPYCSDYDRLPESFSDAMGVKIFADYFRNPQYQKAKLTKKNWQAGLINIGKLMFSARKDACEPKYMYGLYQTNHTFEYVAPHFRINATIMANKDIRRLAGCKEPSPYQQCL